MRSTPYSVQTGTLPAGQRAEQPIAASHHGEPAPRCPRPLRWRCASEKHKSQCTPREAIICCGRALRHDHSAHFRASPHGGWLMYGVQRYGEGKRTKAAAAAAALSAKKAHPLLPRWTHAPHPLQRRNPPPRSRPAEFPPDPPQAGRKQHSGCTGHPVIICLYYAGGTLSSGPGS